ncbi:hypothetical protein GCM10011314_26040 [Knoellia flava]|uniref:Uncharacterized protein n=1 Tax=Knoellia flava TaxID=913969 RepID=A0A8H9FTX5_9MICO|nr:hypothetical protein GCM10011314_26040 [Knoellia flava]
MRRLPEAPSLPGVSTVLEGLSATIASVEDDLLASLVVLGESDPQRSVDGWVDQVVDLLRAVDEVAAQHRTTLALAHSRATARGGSAPEDAASDEVRATVDSSRRDPP